MAGLLLFPAMNRLFWPAKAYRPTRPEQGKQTTRYRTPLNRLFQAREGALTAQTRFIAFGEGPPNAVFCVGDPGPGLGAAPPVLGTVSPRKYAKAG